MKMESHEAGNDFDGLGRDMDLAQRLEALDPESSLSGYWDRFHASVMSDAARALAERRLMATLTVGDVLTSWGRTIVPTAALAAAAAGILLLRASAVAPLPELAEVAEPVPVEAEPVPVLLSPSAAAGLVASLPEGF